MEGNVSRSSLNWSDSFGWDSINISYAFIEILLMLVIVGGNGVVLFAVVKSASLRRVANYFIASLAISDILVALSLPLVIIGFLYFEVALNFYGCITKYILLQGTVCCSTWNIVAIAIDRYIAVCYPLRYCCLMTAERAAVVIVATWIFSLVYSFLPYVGWHQWHFGVECSFNTVLTPLYRIVASLFLVILPLAFVVALYARIFHAVHKQQRQMSERMAAGADRTLSASFLNSLYVKVVITFLFILTRLPFIVLVTVEAIVDSKQYDCLAIARNYAALLTVTNSFMNPIVYALRMSEFQAAYRRIFCARKVSPEGEDRDTMPWTLPSVA